MHLPYSLAFAQQCSSQAAMRGKDKLVFVLLSCLAKRLVGSSKVFSREILEP